MKPFENFSGIAAPLMITNIDTDMIIPKQFLKTIHRTGLGKFAFHELRSLEDGTANPDFILNKTPFDKAKIIVAGDNFGCGSSREHAPWALTDFGIKAIISTSFADIFYNNCFENSLLPAIIDHKDRDKIIQFIKTSTDKKIDINLKDKYIIAGADKIPFYMNDSLQNRLLQGLDSIGMTLEKQENITKFEQERAIKMPWL